MKELRTLVGDNKDHTPRPSLLECCWLARTPLALLAYDSTLASCLRPTTPKDLKASCVDEPWLSTGDGGRQQASMSDMLLVTSGEILKHPHPDATLEVHLLDETNGGAPEIYAGGDAYTGQLELLVAAVYPQRCHTVNNMSAGLADLGLCVRDATTGIDEDGVAHNAFHVTLPEGDQRSAQVRAGELQLKIKMLQSSMLRAGDAMLVVDADGCSRLGRLAVPESANRFAGLSRDRSLSTLPLSAVAERERSLSNMRSSLSSVAGRWQAAMLKLAPGSVGGSGTFDGSGKFNGLGKFDGSVASPKPTGVGLALLDLEEFGTTLAKSDNEVAVLWRRFLSCHAPELLPGGENGPPSAVVASRPHFMRDSGCMGSSGRVGTWDSLLRAFCLFRLRQLDDPDVGVLLPHLELGFRLGEGGYGVVHLARHRVSGALYAVKSFPKSRIRRIEERTTYMRLERERQVLRLLAGELRGGIQPHILVRLICSGHDNEWLRLVLPAYLGGDLSKLIDETGKLSEESVQFYAACMISALQKLHTLGIAYRDLKPENILLTGRAGAHGQSGWPVLTDFGLVAMVGNGARANSMVGTPEFMAPEVVAGGGHDTDCDWWSFGVLLCELLTLVTPFREADGLAGNHQKTYNNIVHGRYTKAYTEKAHKKLPSRTAQLIDSLLQVEPNERLGGNCRGPESIRVHPFFWGLSWEAVEQRDLTPPHAEYCSKKAASAVADFSTSAQVLPITSSPTVKSQHISDPAAAAMDKMFDFSEW